MRMYRWVLAVIAAAGVAVGLAAAGGSATSMFPTSIEQLNLDGYQFVSSYPLGFDAGNTFKQSYGATAASYVTLKGPFFGSNGSGISYRALPIAHNIFMVVWLFSDGTHNSFVYNLNNGRISVVTAGRDGDPSLGEVKVLRVGAHPIP